ncbi:Phosphoribosylaminoimidazole-succinocarboxamide synthase [Pseudolycoriella hygida]|uniref:phosphoribosylaminoimidazolesuccinocarboxamide synthase n=1 Tax=Pseudolycoriella hygida TaxID=35572 RepID=A0A9Q0N8R9_9DIPT|nr:Phosphoribosylaminoimidazole-succinocarboxamide synthase [Pseudolycoriella hygida]
MSKLDMLGIDNHLIEKINMREQLIQSVDVFPIQTIVSSVACGRLVQDFSLEEGYVLDCPIIDFRVKGRELKYPIINEHQILNFGWLTNTELQEVKKKAIRIYDFLSGLFIGIGIRIVECILEFGRVFNGEEFIVMLADEISPDNCRLWHINNNEKLGIELMYVDQEKGIKSYQIITNLLKDNAQ